MTFRDTTGRLRLPDVEASVRGDPRTAVILAFGQSNIANEGDPNGLHVAGDRVYNFNIFDGHCYSARDPLLGASCDRSNFLARLGDLLVDRGVYDRVLLVPIGQGGTYIHNWAPGGTMFPLLLAALEQLRRAQIPLTHILWQQGEAEAAQPNANGEVWARHFNWITVSIRRHGVEAPIFVAQGTICCNGPNEIIRAAQRGVVNPAGGILAGPDTDEIGREDRWDGCHFSTTGLQKAAELWFAAIRTATTRESLTPSS